MQREWIGILFAVDSLVAALGHLEYWVDQVGNDSHFPKDRTLLAVLDSGQSWHLGCSE